MTARAGRPRLLAIANFAADHGTERMIHAVLPGLTDALEIHLLPAQTQGLLFADLSRRVHVSGRLRGHRKRGAFWVNRLRILWHLWMFRPDLLMVFNVQWGIAAGAALRWLPPSRRPRHALLVHHLSVKLMASATERKRMARHLPRFSRHIVPSRGLGQELLRVVPAIAPASVRTVPNGLDASSIQALADRPVPAMPGIEHRWLCVYVGGLRPDKAVDRLLRCFSRLPERESVLLLLIGDGECRPMLERQAADLGLGDRCRFLGQQENPYPYMRRADLLVQASDCETFGLSLLEAMMLGTAVLAMNGLSAGLTDVVHDGVNGRLVDAGDEAAFVQAWSGLLRQPDMRQRLADRAHADAGAFSRQAMIEGYRQELGL